jgi:hypothetical protein
MLVHKTKENDTMDTLLYTWSNVKFGRALDQAVNRRLLTTEAQVRSRVSPYGICGEQNGTGTGFSLSI